MEGRLFPLERTASLTWAPRGVISLSLGESGTECVWGHSGDMVPDTANATRSTPTSYANGWEGEAKE